MKFLSNDGYEKIQTAFLSLQRHTAVARHITQVMQQVEISSFRSRYNFLIQLVLEFSSNPTRLPHFEDYFSSSIFLCRVIQINSKVLHSSVGITSYQNIYQRLKA